MLTALWRWLTELLCNHDWDRTRGYGEYPVPGAICRLCLKQFK